MHERQSEIYRRGHELEEVWVVSIQIQKTKNSTPKKTEKKGSWLYDGGNGVKVLLKGGWGGAGHSTHKIG